MSSKSVYERMPLREEFEKRVDKADFIVGKHLLENKGPPIILRDKGAAHEKKVFFVVVLVFIELGSTKVNDIFDNLFVTQS